MRQLQGGFAPLTPHQGLCPWTPLGAKPPDPLIGSRYRAHHNAADHTHAISIWLASLHTVEINTFFVIIGVRTELPGKWERTHTGEKSFLCNMCDYQKVTEQSPHI